MRDNVISLIELGNSLLHRSPNVEGEHVLPRRILACMMPKCGSFIMQKGNAHLNLLSNFY